MAGLRRLVAVAALLKLVMADGFLNLEKRAVHPLPDLSNHLQARQAGGQGCLTLLSISSSCEAASPSFSSLPATAQLSCYCATPTRFDGALASCTPYLSSADPDAYSSFSDALPTSPCAALGIGGGGGNDATTSTTIFTTRTTTVTSRTTRSVSSASSDPYLEACSSAFSIEESCKAATPSLSTATKITDGFSCLCYSNNRFDPDYYDDPRSSCYEYLKTADPPAYQTLVRSSNTATAPCADTEDGGITQGGSSPTTRSLPNGPTTTSRPQGSSGSVTGGPSDGVSLNIRGASFMAFAGALTLVLALIL